ncbi:MAG: PorP/SprF family type IX secretion system membrane protein [Flammeovirgaceae bacterium]|nr:PorP/SprF family type IX secretion system membrane protein [Flammeovirgaceae bacterium]
MKKLRGLIATILIGLFSPSHAQYFQFSQYNFSQQRINPALVGNTRHTTVSLLSRTQKTGGDFNIMSNFLSATYPLLNSSTGKPWSGIGITVMDDRSGGIFKTQEAALSYALHLRIDRFQSLSLGFKGVFQTKSISLDGYNTSRQYVPDRGFSNSIANGENIAELRETYHTFSAGLYWQRVDRKEMKIAYWGVSLFDFNKPKDNFLGSTNNLSSTLIAEGGFRVYQQRELSVFPEVLVTSNSGNVTINTGLRFQYEIKPMPNQASSARIDVLTKYVPGRSGIVGIQFHRENFSFGASYDFPFMVSNTGNLGALEVGLEVRKLISTRNEKYRAKRAKEIEARKKATKAIALKNSAKNKTLDSLKAISVENRMTDSTSIKKLIVVQQFDSTKLNYEANAGKLNQEPYLVEKITLRFQFKFNSADLDNDSEDFLNELSKTLETDPRLQIKIIGHTDNVGSHKFNEHLSLKRAEIVQKFLTTRGLSQSRVTAEGKGMSQPLTENETEKGRAANRRVEILLFRN